MNRIAWLLPCKTHGQSDKWLQAFVPFVLVAVVAVDVCTNCNRTNVADLYGSTLARCVVSVLTPLGSALLPVCVVELGEWTS